MQIVVKNLCPPPQKKSTHIPHLQQWFLKSTEWLLWKVDGVMFASVKKIINWYLCKMHNYCVKMMRKQNSFCPSGGLKATHMIHIYTFNTQFSFIYFNLLYSTYYVNVTQILFQISIHWPICASFSLLARENVS